MFPARRCREKEPGGGQYRANEGAEQAHPPILRPASQWRRESPPTAEPTVTLETPRGGWAGLANVPLDKLGAMLRIEMEVIRDQF